MTLDGVPIQQKHFAYGYVLSLQKQTEEPSHALSVKSSPPSCVF